MSDFEYHIGEGLFESVKKRIRKVANLSGQFEASDTYWWLDGRILGKLVGDRWEVVQLDKVNGIKIDIETRAKQDRKAEGAPAMKEWTRTLVINYPGGDETLSAGYDPDAEAFIDKVLAALSGRNTA
ncbi:hypothetical protein A5741_01455 [Mycolicibacterium conceptionense]|uniref:hypothetical protein n=1 Tax=Mycolicibacterium conceptionense TaxID=451644 RepID=UPI00096FAAE1|nr:hypothetical protein [Mycolicibacterium conceptionense]OMB88866.1 hypothetical protein A5741_01455 [Mycolicibacterium conceptionense]